MGAPANLWFGVNSQFDSIRKSKLNHFQHYFWIRWENQCSISSWNSDSILLIRWESVGNNCSTDIHRQSVTSSWEYIIPWFAEVFWFIFLLAQTLTESGNAIISPEYFFWSHFRAESMYFWSHPYSWKTCNGFFSLLVSHNKSNFCSDHNTAYCWPQHGAHPSRKYIMCCHCESHSDCWQISQILKHKHV